MRVGTAPLLCEETAQTGQWISLFGSHLSLFLIAHVELRGQVIKGANTGVMMPVLVSRRDIEEKA